MPGSIEAGKRAVLSEFEEGCKGIYLDFSPLLQKMGLALALATPR